METPYTKRALEPMVCTRMRTLRMNYLGLELTDAQGTVVGQVVDTYPYDGGGELDMVIVRLRRFGERRMLPVAELRFIWGRLVAPFSRLQIEDAPEMSEGANVAEDPWRAKTYWHYEDPA